jgi:peroxiredoxin
MITIKDDNITWAQVSDLKRWASPVAKQYGVEEIPANFLIDPDGKIIAKNLHGDQLEEKLESLLK